MTPEEIYALGAKLQIEAAEEAHLAQMAMQTGNMKEYLHERYERLKARADE